jgi:hypothetical protein
MGTPRSAAAVRLAGTTTVSTGQVASGVDERALRRRCQTLVRDLRLPEPFDVTEVCAKLGERRGRPIVLLALDAPGTGPCGVWVATPHNDYIFYEARTAPLHQWHIIAHELGHLIHDHRSAGVLGDEAARALMPGLDPAMVQQVLGRTHYSADEEREAEIFASVVMQWADRRRLTVHPSALPQGVGAELDRFSSVLDANRPWHG